MNRPLRIAVIVGAFPEISETFILHQITGLLDLGHEVDIYSDMRSDMRGEIHPEIQKHHLLERTTFLDSPPESGVWELPVWPLNGKTWPPGGEKPIPNWRRLCRALPLMARCFAKAPRLTRRVLSQREYGFQAASLSAFYRLAKLCQARKCYDAIHAHFGPVASSFRFTGELWHAPLLVSFHGYDVSTFPKKAGPSVYQKLFAEADAVTANSDFMSAKLLALGCPADKIQKLHYGIDLSSISVPQRDRTAGEPVRVLSIARLTEKKGIEYAIRAVAEVRRTHPRIAFGILGDGPLRANINELIHELDQADAITLHGAKNSDGVREALNQSDIFLLPSVTAANGDEEGTPVSLLEAQAAGLPVISTWHAGIPEIVLAGETGWLVPERDVTGLAEKLRLLVEQPEWRRKMGSRGRQHIEARFDLRTLNRDLVAIYEQLIADFGE